MLAAHAVILALAVAWSFFMIFTHRFLFLVLFILLTPLFVILVNLLNSPLERAISNWYISDAKRILREMPHLIVIGITGSYGKTSTKYFLAKLLSYKYNTLMTPGSFNTPMGVVKTVREQLRPIHDVFVCEMGAKHVGDIKELCDLVNPRYGILTAIGPQHLDTQGTMENIEKTKFELPYALPDDGTAFLSYDYDRIRNRNYDRPM